MNPPILKTVTKEFVERVCPDCGSAVLTQDATLHIRASYDVREDRHYDIHRCLKCPWEYLERVSP